MDVLALTKTLQHSLLQVIALGLAAAVLVAAYHEYLRLSSRVKRLPGPSGWPIIGNLYQVKGKPAYEIYRQWSEKFGPVFQGTLSYGCRSMKFSSAHLQCFSSTWFAAFGHHQRCQVCP